MTFSSPDGLPLLAIDALSPALASSSDGDNGIGNIIVDNSSLGSSGDLEDDNDCVVRSTTSLSPPTPVIRPSL